MDLFTIGFTKKSAEQFFSILKENKVDLLVDIRLSPNSQLAGFAKQDNLPYFLKKLIDCDYRYEPLLTPVKELMTSYRKDKDWAAYKTKYISLLKERKVLDHLDKDMYANHNACFLCSEFKADHCHRRLAAEFLKNNWENVNIKHL